MTDIKLNKPKTKEDREMWNIARELKIVEELNK